MTDNNTPNPSAEGAEGGEATKEPVVRTPEANPEGGTGNEGGDGTRNAPEGTKPEGEGGDVDYKEKFGHSTKENQRLLDVLKDNKIDPKTGKPIEQPTEQPVRKPTEPTQPSNLTDEELAKALPAFNTMSEDEKAIIRNAQQTAKDMAEMKRFIAVMQDEKTYNEQFSTLTSKEEYKAIGEDAEAFKEFAYKPENLNTDLAVLADAYLARKAREATTEGDKPKGEAPKGMEEGTSGAKDIGGKDGVQELTAEQAADLRKKEPRKYIQMASKGLIKIIEG